MSKKSVEEQFNEVLDHYILGEGDMTKDSPSEEVDELLSIGKDLWDDRVCEKINEDKLRKTFMDQLKREKERENQIMKKGKVMKTAVIVASMVGVLSIGMTQTAFGKEMIESIIAHFSTGHGNVLQYDAEEQEARKQAIIEKCKSEPMPEEYKGKIFDENGNEFTYFPAYLKGAYNANGEPIMCVKDGMVFTEEEWEEYYNEVEANEAYTEITDLSKISDYTCFEVKMPTYLPEGVEFKTAGVWSEEDVTDNVCIELSFVNEAGEEVIYMQQRFVCEEAAYETGTSGEVKELEINGAKGLMYDNSLNWETAEVMYLMNSLSDEVSGDEMIKIAESIK